MKWLFVLVVLLIVIVTYWLLSYGDWHLKRNKRNRLPEGKLSLSGSNAYVDEHGRTWWLQPHDRNIFHQPDTLPLPSEEPEPYPIVSPTPEYDPYHPNLKFLSPDDGGGSFEAILQPDGTFLLSGKKQGTYNYGHPEGFAGFVIHTFADVIPHIFNSAYKEVKQQKQSL
jgi:hypothetical protein